MLAFRKVVFFGAHTDDEMVAAGTLHRLVRQGAEVHVVTFSPAGTKDDRRGGPESSRVVYAEWNESMREIGAVRSEFHNLTPSVDLRPFGQVIADTIFQYIEFHQPDAAFILSPDDENPAHAVVGVESERVMRGRVATVLRCHFPYNYTIGRPNLFVQLDRSDVDCKRRVIDCYRSQHWRYGYEQMLLSYAEADALAVKAGTSHVEKFEVIRSVV